MYPPLHHFIAGQAVSGAEHIDVTNPFDHRVLGRLPVATPEDLSDAVDAARAAGPVWSGTPAYARAQVLRRAAGLLRERAHGFACAMVLESGKPLHEAKAELEAAAEAFEWSAEEARRPDGYSMQGRQPGGQFLVTQEPVGIVAAFSPWNFPAVTLAKKIAPALAAGCTVVAKPAEETPATALALANCLADAGLPPGGLNLVFGQPSMISTYMIDHPEVRKISFTGSTAVGRTLAAAAGASLKMMTLELGGHAPVIVTAERDPVAAAQSCALAKFRNAGQNCTSPTRFFVAREIYPDFVSAFAAAASAIEVGDGLQPQTQMGPLIHGRRCDAVADLIEEALSCGARLMTGGGRLAPGSNLFAPSVLADVPLEAKAMKVEPFGPLALLRPFDALDDAILEANSTPFGLTGYALTGCPDTAHKIARRLRVGMVGLNSFALAFAEAPFGGMGESGYGREGGPDSLAGYRTTKFVHSTGLHP